MCKIDGQLEGRRVPNKNEAFAFCTPHLSLVLPVFFLSNVNLLETQSSNKESWFGRKSTPKGWHDGMGWGGGCLLTQFTFLQQHWTAFPCCTKLPLHSSCSCHLCNLDHFAHFANHQPLLLLSSPVLHWLESGSMCRYRCRWPTPIELFAVEPFYIVTTCILLHCTCNALQM